MRAARPAHPAEAPHERGQREDDDLAFRELFEALRSSLVLSVGTTDAHAQKKATIDARPRLDAARAQLDQSWTARLEGDARERHERRLASIRASLARVARRRDAFDDRVRASLARVCLEEDALASDAAARAEATAVRAESVAGAWRAETLASAAFSSAARAAEEAAVARDALLAAHDERSLLALARGVFGRRGEGARANVAPAKDPARARVEALVEALSVSEHGDVDVRADERLRVTSVVSLEVEGDAAARGNADFVLEPKKEAPRRVSSLSRGEARFPTRKKKAPLSSRAEPRWGACLVPLTGARGADGAGGKRNRAARRKIAAAARVGVTLAAAPEETPSSMSPRRPRSAGSRAVFGAAFGDDEDVSSDDEDVSSDDEDVSSDDGFPPETRLASFAAASERAPSGETSDPRVFALYDFERDSEGSEDANQVRAWDERFRRRRVATVAHLRRVLEERSEPEGREETKRLQKKTGARLGLFFLRTRLRDEARNVRGDGADDDRSTELSSALETDLASSNSDRARFVPLTDRALAELARAYLSRRARRASRPRGASPRRAKASTPDQDAFVSSDDAGGVSIALVYDETAAVPSVRSEGKTVKPAFLASARREKKSAREAFRRGAGSSRDANDLDALRATSTTSMRASDVVSVIAEAASAASAEHAGDGGRADRFPRLEPEAFASSEVFPPLRLGRLLGGPAPRDWSARDEELDAAAEALGDAEEEIEALIASRARARDALRERNE